MREIGTIIQYDGKTNHLFHNGNVKEVPIGGLICEYDRFDPTELKEILVNYEKKNEALSIDSVSQSLVYLLNQTNDKFGEIVSSMIVTEFLSSLEDLVTFDKIKIYEHLNELNKSTENNPLREYILENTGTNMFLVDTIGNALNYAYYGFILSYSIFKKVFSDTMNFMSEINSTDKCENNKMIEKIISLYCENSNFQSIDYKIMNIGGKLSSVYTIKDSISLFAFELAHIVESDAIIKKCKNCNHYYVPQSRIDSLYCNYPSPQNHNKLCKDIGAQITRAKKEKEDEFTKEYRKQYMRLQMKCRRHSEDLSYSNMLKQLVSDAKIWREKIKEDKVSKSDWKQWLDGYSSK